MIYEIIKAFIVGGLICVIGQFLIDYTKMTPARILTGFVVAGVVISAFGWYKPLINFAGEGAGVPLIGFGHILAEGIRRNVDRDGFIGVFTGGMSAAAGGITAAILFGLLASLIFKQKDKT